MGLYVLGLMEGGPASRSQKMQVCFPPATLYLVHCSVLKNRLTQRSCVVLHYVSRGFQVKLKMF